MNTYSIPGFADPFSSFSHLGAAIVFLGLIVPLWHRGKSHWSHRAALMLFGLSCVILLALSGVYHLLPVETTGRFVLRELDHAAIFLLIAASFTPIHVIRFRGFMRWGFLMLIWTLAITGIALKAIFFGALPEWLGLVIYLMIGWLGLVSGISLWRRFGARFTRPLLLGGLAYSIGALVDYLRWPVVVPGVIAAHEIFHIMVLFGIGWHWQFIWRLAAPTRYRDQVRTEADRGTTTPASR